MSSPHLHHCHIITTPHHYHVIITPHRHVTNNAISPPPLSHRHYTTSPPLPCHDEIVSIFADPTLQLHTTRSWDFLDTESGIRSKHRYPHVSGEDVIIGVIDTGIWPESPSFNDEGIGEIPSRWKGVCMEGSDFKKSDCNRKLIGARYYNIRDDMAKPESSSNKTQRPTGSPRDFVGHGTHTASTAAGAMVANASYYGLAQGTARGGSPSSRLAIYKACSLGGCSGATLLKAIDDAIKDGVDIISISIGVSSIIQSDFLNDPIAIGAFHANEKGILVICAGGNDGPDPYSVVNSAPWILTVAASNIDRAFLSNIVLGSGHIIHGSAINFSNLTRSKSYPLAFGADIAATSTPLSEASNCYPGSLDLKKTAGKIVVCVDTNPMVSRRIKKLVVESSHAKGMILINEAEKGEPFDSGVFPFSEIGDIDGVEILKYINTTKNPTATILPTMEIKRFKPAPIVASFSSRGPGGLTETILKPDITAPGVAILAAMIPNTDKGSVPAGKKPSKFALKSGTSMACPHVAGAAAFIKSVHRDWSTSMIKSALMTTAITSNNIGKPLTNTSDAFASPHEMGAGEINPLRALNPGLIYQTTTKDYLYFLCYYGYKQKIIRSISGTNFTCPSNSLEDFISDLNYPSISISKLEQHRSVRTVMRTVTNVGSKNATYIAKIDSPRTAGLIVKVSPEKLAFTDKGSMEASFKVSFYDKGSTKGYKFGYVTWSDGVHFVRTVFAVNVV
ncbi:Peptidase S8/S53 domain [Macleaya cordata]|uniref:Peptidase S8/S53 domain n=1 Tax=Macleaya cordata TaxID=56857 RepID=A0A200QTK9_MACCD|nr:Peptidase S8/S53 domain [Macleaya cordata]